MRQRGKKGAIAKTQNALLFRPCLTPLSLIYSLKCKSICGFVDCPTC